jgi:hypothetical protein
MKNQEMIESLKYMEDCFYNVEVVYRAYRSDITVWVPVLALDYETAQVKAAEFVKKTQFVSDESYILSVNCFKLINAL